MTTETRYTPFLAETVKTEDVTTKGKKVVSLLNMFPGLNQLKLLMNIAMAGLGI